MSIRAGGSANAGEDNAASARKMTFFIKVGKQSKETSVCKTEPMARGSGKHCFAH